MPLLSVASGCAVESCAVESCAVVSVAMLGMVFLPSVPSWVHSV
jgi:hypothetical protein